MKKTINLTCFIFLFVTFLGQTAFTKETKKLLSTDWSFKGYFGKFDRASLQRGYHVYKEVCASCHSMTYLSYRNLAEAGGQNFQKNRRRLLLQILK